MSAARDIIHRPVVSEKSYALMDEGTYTFIVAPDATKPAIASAVEEIWGVKVASVNTINRRGKLKRYRTTMGQRPGTKRAIVKLAEGDKIELFETR